MKAKFKFKHLYDGGEEISDLEAKTKFLKTLPIEIDNPDREFIVETIGTWMFEVYPEKGTQNYEISNKLLEKYDVKITSNTETTQSIQDRYAQKSTEIQGRTDILPHLIITSKNYEKNFMNAHFYTIDPHKFPKRELF